MNDTQNNITHVALVVDESLSMARHHTTVIKLVEDQIQHLAKRSAELDQETRISVYTFNHEVKCRIFDKDVLRLPSFAGLYRPAGRTALIDAVIQSQEDLAQTAQTYGKHAFLTITITDGQENESRRRPGDLRRTLAGLPPDWTLACMVPDAMGKDDAQAFGFAPANIAIWDPTNTRGVEDAGSVIRQATDSFMRGRASGVHSTTSLFSTGIDAVNDATVKASLKLISPQAFAVLKVDQDSYITEFVRSRGIQYKRGAGFYQLTKPETIHHHKDVIVRKKATGEVFGGPAARDLIGLSATNEKVKPDPNEEYETFVQSTSGNRKLIAGTELLLMN